MAQVYEVVKHTEFLGAFVRVIRRTPTKTHSHLVLVEAVIPHPRCPKEERFEIDMRDLKLRRDKIRWTDPTEFSPPQIRKRDQE